MRFPLEIFAGVCCVVGLKMNENKQGRSERAVLWVLAAVQFTHILDFMIMLPMGDRLMKTFQISPQQFSHLAMSYGLAAAISGLAGGAVIDRFERKRALLFLYAGFTVSTFACALAPSEGWLMAARCLCGAFGGVAGSMVGVVVSDVVPPERRGRGMGVVMTAFPLASVLGVPLGLFLCNRYDWHAPFYLLAAAGVVVWVVAWRVLPVLPAQRGTEHPWRQLWEIVSRRIHVLGLAMSGLMVLGGSVVVSFLAPSFIANVGIEEARLPWVYAVGGVATFACTPVIGRLSDRFDKLWVLAAMTVLMVGAAFLVTHLPVSPLWVAAGAIALFMVASSGRFAPGMSMLTIAVEERWRGGFMSVNSSMQQGAAALGSWLAGLLVTKAADGRLVGYERTAWISAAAVLATLVVAAALRRAAPHAAKPRGR